MNQRVCLAACVAAVLAAVGCGSTSTTTTGPSPVRCEVALGAPGTLGSAGGTGTISIKTQPECSWNASTTEPWITRLTPTSGQGTAQIQIDVASNPDPTERVGTVVVNSTLVSVTQDPTTCTFAVSPTIATLAAAGGSPAIAVTTIAGCGWTATSGAPWITIASGGTGSGNGTVNVQVAANTGVARTGSLTVAGQTVTLSQSASGTSACTYAIQPTAQTAQASGGPATASVTAGAGCAWTATTDVPWLTISGAVAGNGNGTVAFNVGTNVSPAARSGRVIIEGLSPGDRPALTVTQSQGSQTCTYAINPSSGQVGAAGGSIGVSVSATAGCVWTAASNAPWLTIGAGGTTGNGSGAVTVNVAATDGPQRSGTLTIAGQTFTVTQTNGCTYAINPAQLTIDAAGGPSSTAVTAGTGCAWNAAVSAQSPWITLTSGASGSGSGTVAFAVAANAGPPRNGSLTIAGQTFTVNQVDGCAYSISPNSASVGAGGGEAGTTVTAGPNCAWNASSNASWITITSGASGTGGGPVGFSVAGHSGPAREGTLTIAGQTFTVSQASGCSYTIFPTSQTVGAGGGQGSTAITTSDGCEWTAESQSSWIHLNAGSGSGNRAAIVSFTVDANTGPQRIGTLAIAGQTFTMTQADGCVYSIAPTSQTVTAAGIPAPGSTVAVTAGAGCDWAATSHAAFLTITAGDSGSGSGTARFTVQQNTGAQRTGTLTIAGHTFTVTQASGCSPSINPTQLNNVAAAGIPAPGSTVAVTAGAGCGWTATSNAAFLTITEGASGSENGNVSFTVQQNTGAQRTGTLTIAGHTFTVTQTAGCSPSISPTSQTGVAAAGIPAPGSTVTVTAGTGCGWTATSNAAFLAITEGASGSGTGTVRFTVQPNSGQQRTGTLTIAGHTFTVTQTSGCSFTLNPTQLTNVAAAGVPAPGSTVAVTATAPACAWAASSNASFLAITEGASGSGNGNVRFSVQPNSGPQRTGTLSIAGHTFTVTQNSGCSFTINPTSQTVAAAGIPAPGAPVSVTTGAGCAWTASSNAAFLAIGAGSPGNGSGTVNFTAQANSGPQRSGTLTIAGQTFTVTQLNGCTYTLAVSPTTFTAIGGSGAVTVTAGTGCAWTVSNGGAGWVTLATPVNGTGNGKVAFTVQPGVITRTTTITLTGTSGPVTPSGGVQIRQN